MGAVVARCALWRNVERAAGKGKRPLFNNDSIMNEVK